MTFPTPRGNGRFQFNTLALAAMASAGPPNVSAMSAVDFEKPDAGGLSSIKRCDLIDSGGGGKLRDKSVVLGGVNKASEVGIDKGHKAAALGVRKANDLIGAVGH